MQLSVLFSYCMLCIFNKIVTAELNVIIYTCNLSVQEAEAEESRVQISLGHIVNYYHLPTTVYTETLSQKCQNTK